MNFFFTFSVLVSNSNKLKHFTDSIGSFQQGSTWEVDNIQRLIVHPRLGSLRYSGTAVAKKVIPMEPLQTECHWRKNNSDFLECHRTRHLETSVLKPREKLKRNICSILLL